MLQKGIVYMNEYIKCDSAYKIYDPMRNKHFKQTTKRRSFAKRTKALNDYKLKDFKSVNRFTA